MFREQPELIHDRLCDASMRITIEQAKAVASTLENEAAIEGCTLDLIDLLTGRGFPKGTSRLAVRQWGNRAAQKIRRDPYCLMNFRGCGFKRTDALYLDLKLPPARLKRQALSAWYALASDSEGHTWHPDTKAIRGIQGNIAGAELQIERALRLARIAGATAELFTAGGHGPICQGADSPGAYRWIAEGRKSRNEGELARRVADAAIETTVVAWPDASILDERVTEHQREHYAKATSGPIGILGGGPGCGKTFVVAALVKALVRSIGINQIAVGAPTGKAAVRVTECLAGHQIPLRARTWHSLLMGGLGGGFTYNETNPLPFKVLIGDETSMVDTDLMAAVFRARSVGTLVLLVGDVNQLPPVGHGAPLRDMIAAGLPYGELREIKRASGGIVETCAAIRDGKPWEPGDNLKVFEHAEPESQIKRMVQLLSASRGEGFDPVWDCQVLVPVNKKSPLARAALNKLLQNELNQNAAVGGSPFRLGDKVCNTKNGYFTAVDADFSDEETQRNERGEVYVANGELGEVIEVAEKFIVVKLASPARVVRVPRGKQAEVDGDGELVTDGGADEGPATGCSWDLGYCLSTHKAQGSEFPVVIVMIDEYPGAKLVCSREWIYTAISRAKSHCLLVGKKSVAESMCRRPSLTKRKTLLKERVLLERAKLELADL